MTKKENELKVTTRTKIYALLDRSVKPKDIAKRLNIPVQSVYSAKYLRFKGAPKRRGRPAKTVTVTASQPLLSKVILEDKLEAQNIEIVNLKHQIIGFRAVISYLEDLSGIRDSQ